MQQALHTLQRSCRELGAKLDASCPPPELQLCATRARTLAAALAQIINEPGPRDDDAEADGEGWQPEGSGAASVAGARTVSTHARGFALRLLPYEIASRFQAQLSQGHSAWIFTSATLAVGDDFSHFASRLGLDDAAALRFDSPFDYSRQALLYLPQGLPQPSDPGFGDAVIETARPLLESAGGGAFVLFTSHRALRHAAQRLTGVRCRPSCRCWFRAARRASCCCVAFAPAAGRCCSAPRASGKAWTCRDRRCGW